MLKDKMKIGWNEWCALPDLNLPAIKAKIDTGAKTSSLHAFDIHTVKRGERTFAHFQIHPIQHNDELIIECKALVIDERFIMSSSGHKEHRLVISTPITLGNNTWDIQITLSNRDPLSYRMLLGREAMEHRVIIDPSRKFQLGKITKQQLQKLYTETYKKSN